ncbi:MAG: S8 family serine peptidase [Zhongshania sp.]|uniref:CFI-box-CTERM domain-containing protein n=1 Tax=Zhongshania sp. TaxID=1971902 RepID=UPI002630DAEB|nr:CFI-box-CTERM domain-containing protein [Zhongshania sp.]MDF1693508.1 S8 family serine peptidase [Zhongshania sp.]
MSVNTNWAALLIGGLVLSSQASIAELNLKQKLAQESATVGKIDSHLRSLVSPETPEFASTIRTNPQPELRMQRSANVAADQGLLLVLQLNDAKDLPAFLSEHGIDLLFLSDNGRHATVRAYNSNAILALAEQSGVQSLSLAEPSVLRIGSVTSRGGRAMGATSISNTLAVDGSGQTIGIVSDSFAQTASVRGNNTTPAKGIAGNLQSARNQISGDLPPVIKLLRDDVEKGTDEGAAMAELIYDVAPGVDLLFHAAGNSRAELAVAINTLCAANNASIVVDDILFISESTYQDDAPAAAATRCVAAGIPYLSAAGNDGDQAYRYVYNDANTTLDEPGTTLWPTGNDLHNWSSNNNPDRFLSITLNPNSTIYVVLNWNQPYASISPAKGAQIDLDLYATTAANVLALNPNSPDFYERGANKQGITGQPDGDAYEFVKLVTGAASQTFYIAVEHFDGSQGDIPQQTGVPLEFRILLTGGQPSAVEYSFNGVAVWGHTAAANIASVAAVPWWESPEFRPEGYDTLGIDPEPFSSLGGVLEIQFDQNGNYLRQSRTVPSFSAIDGNNNTFLGASSNNVAPEDGEPDNFPNFFGTSAAAPNAAAVFALLKQAYATATPAQLISAVQTTAIDVNGGRARTGYDDVSANGLINAEAAASALSIAVGNPAPAPTPSAPVAQSGGGGGGGGACFIATAAYGSYLAPDVKILRDFRDNVLLPYTWGRKFVAAYYHYSPPVANYIAGSNTLRFVSRVGLSPLVYGLKYPLWSVISLLAALLALRKYQGIEGRANKRR